MTLSLRAGLFPDNLPSCAEMAVLDRATINTGTPALELMESAGSAVYDIVNSRLTIQPGFEDRVLVLCGPGNNGGDGLVVARNLHHDGTCVDVVVAAAAKFSQDFHIQARKLAWDGVKLQIFGEHKLDLEGLEFEAIGESRLDDLYRSATIVVDALLGTGQSQAPRGAVGVLVEKLALCAKSAITISVDVPTGINGDTGEAFQPHIQANVTVCIELIKRGLLQSPGREACGDILVAPIGVGHGQTEFSLIREENIHLPGRRRLGFHKGEAGHVLVIGGSAAMPGACELSAIAALRCGAGLVTMLKLRGQSSMRFSPELMMYVVGKEGDECFAPWHLQEIEGRVASVSSIVLGPGLGQAPETREFVRGVIELLRNCLKMPVIDADALNCLAKDDCLAVGPGSVLTPHPGEMSRLLRCSIEEVQSDRYGAARELSRRTGSVVVLKGSGSVVYSRNNGWVNTSGNPFMATAGSGDVLSGMIAGLFAQTERDSEALLESTRAAVYVHGLAGDLASGYGRHPIIAGDIIRKIPHALWKSQA